MREWRVDGEARARQSASLTPLGGGETALVRRVDLEAVCLDFARAESLMFVVRTGPAGGSPLRALGGAV